jgi:hypothetical protein
MMDAEVKELCMPWADTILYDDIMQSDRLLLMDSMYAMLFEDDEFEQPGSLSLTGSRPFWGMDSETLE